MNDYRIVLEKYKGMNSRFICPKCGNNRKTFVKYIDKERGEYIDEKVGRCNRESECGYHYTPKEFFSDNDIDSYQKKIKVEYVPKPTDYINMGLVKSTIDGDIRNHYIHFLVKRFGVEKTQKVVDQYWIGTLNDWTIFWQIDVHKRVRTGKRMLYHRETGKRFSDAKKSYINWMHEQPFNLKQCFFGEHLIVNGKPIGIVESEKTATICSIVYPEYNWLASGGSNGINSDKCKVLMNYNVTLFPDNDKYSDWEEISNRYHFGIYDGVLQYGGTYDLADVILGNIDKNILLK